MVSLPLVLTLLISPGVMVVCQEMKDTNVGVRVYSLQRGVYTRPTTGVYLRYNLSKVGDASPATATNYTACYWIRFERFHSLTTHVSYATSDQGSNMLLFHHKTNELKAYVNGHLQPHTIQRRWEVTPETWHHLCHVVGPDTHAVWWQGEVFSKGAVEGTGGLPLTGTLIIGQEQDIQGGGFDSRQVLTGDIAQLHIWSRQLADREILDLANCRTRGQGDIFNLDVDEVENFGTELVVVEDVKEFCSSSLHFIVMPEERTASLVNHLCLLFNASMATPNSSQQNLQLLEQYNLFLNACLPSSNYKFWLGIWDEEEEGVWKTIMDERVIDYKNFTPPFPQGGLINNCAMMLPDGGWADTFCKEIKCGACQLKPLDFLYLRGLCFKSDHQTHFRIDGYIDGRPYFRGYYTEIIFWEVENMSWVLKDTQNNQTLAITGELEEDMYPTGLREWEVKKTVCGVHSGTIPLSLSSCPDDQFMCKSGYCIGQEYRCNLRFECNDRSDEDNCNMLETPSGYHRHLPPRGENEHILTLSPSITITRVAGINDISMTVDLEFSFSVTWRDNRVSFRQLQNDSETIVPSDEVDKLWVPNYQMLNLEGGQIKELSKVMTVTTANDATLPDHNSVKRDLVYPGKSNNIVLTHQYIASFTCAFDLYIYPFDIQVCSVDLRLPQSYAGNVEFSAQNRTITYVGQRKLPLFSVKKERFGIQTENGCLSFEYELHRRQGVILLSTFVPSVMLLLISWSTLFIKLEALNVRAMMSLTTMLVLFTLFVNLSRSIPNTAAVKMIDVWFFFIIALLFINIIIHILVDLATTTPGTPRPKSVKLNRVSCQSSVSVSSEPIVQQFFIIHKFFLLPAIFIFFNIGFWLIIWLS